MNEFTHTWEYEGESITFRWLGDVEIPIDRVYAFAFTADSRMLLVSDPSWAPAGWLPGGGVQEAESTLDALRRELLEEANARVLTAIPMGVQRADHSSSGVTHHAFYWARIDVAADFEPMHEVTARYLVTPDEFLDRLFWGRIDPKAPWLLERAMKLNGQAD